MTTPPIIPGNPQEPQPEQYQPASYEPTQPYYPPQQYLPPQPSAQPQQAWNPGRAAGNTVVVLVTLLFVLCVLPVAICVGFGVIGNMASR